MPVDHDDDDDEVEVEEEDKGVEKNDNFLAFRQIGDQETRGAIRHKWAGAGEREREGEKGASGAPSAFLSLTHSLTHWLYTHVHIYLIEFFLI